MRSAVKRNKRKSQREAARMQKQAETNLAMEEDEEIYFNRPESTPDTPRVSRNNTPDPEDDKQRETDYTVVLEMVQNVRDKLAALILDNTNIRAACDDLRRQCHSQGVAFGDLSRLVKQSREDQEETRAFTQEETRSGSSVTAMSDIFYRNLVHAGAPLGALQVTARTLRSANGTGIEVLGCSRCSVSFLGLRTEFPIIICSLATGTDAIIRTDVLGSVLPHTLDIKNGLLFARGGVSLQLHRKDSALSGRVFTVGHSSIPPYSEAVLHCSVRTTGGRALPSSGLLEGLTLFAEDTGLIVGRTLVDPSGWKVPVLVSNFSQETVVVNPFTEVGMITQVTAIQSVADDGIRHPGATGELPHHLQDLVDQTSGDLNEGQRRRLAGVLLEYADIFPVPGDPLTGHTDAVEHDINTGDRSPIRCAPRRMSPQKMKKEEQCVTEMLTGGQIEASDSPWSSPVVLVTKKDGGTRFCVDYRQLNDATIKDSYPLPRIDDTLDMLAGKQWFSTLDLASGYWQVSLSREARAKTAFATHSGLFQFRVMPFGLCNAPATFERLMDRVLQGLRWSRCLVYLDDIISFGGTFDGALSNLTSIFERLRLYGLQLKSSKCHLFRVSVPFLGHIVGRRGLECDPTKIEDVKSWPVPDCLKSV